MTLVYSTRKAPVGSDDRAALAVAGGLPDLGRGSYKRVVVDRTARVVYKLSSSSSPSASVQLAAEAAWSGHLRRQRLAGIPPVSLYRVGSRLVLAMPLYDGRPRHDGSPTSESSRMDGWWEAGLMDVDLYCNNTAHNRRGHAFVIDMSGYGDFPREALRDPGFLLDPNETFVDDAEAASFDLTSTNWDDASVNTPWSQA
jgi:hypothetical protein